MEQEESGPSIQVDMLEDSVLQSRQGWPETHIHTEGGRRQQLNVERGEHFTLPFKMRIANAHLKT